MSYEKQTWTTGDTITAEKLNHIENGIENNGPLVVNATESDNNIVTLDKTWQEIYDAFPNVLLNTIISDARLGKFSIAMCLYDNEKYRIETTIGTYVTNSANGYPNNDDDEGEMNPK